MQGQQAARNKVKSQEVSKTRVYVERVLACIYTLVLQYWLLLATVVLGTRGTQSRSYRALFFAKLRNLRTILSDVAPTKMSLQNFILIGNKISQTPQPSQTCLKSPRGYKFCSIYTVW